MGLRPFFLPLFTGVRGRGILRSSPITISRKFAPDIGQWHHAPLSSIGLTRRASVLGKEASKIMRIITGQKEG
jgi:hypothetical protein